MYRRIAIYCQVVWIQLVVMIIIVIAVLVLGSIDVHALSISPLRQTQVVKPGDEAVLIVAVRNDENELITIGGEVDAFTIDPQTGQAHFGAADYAKRWVEITSKQKVLAPHEKTELIFTVTVPVNAEPGGHYLGLFATQAAGTGDIGIRSRVGTLLFLYVAGSVEENISVTDFSFGSRWVWRGPVEVFLGVHNDGSIHVVPTGTVTVANRTGEIVVNAPINAAKRLILPDARWQEQFSLIVPWWQIGPLSVQGVIEYGLSEQTATVSGMVWYVPWWVIGLGVLGVIILCGGAAYRVRARLKR